MSYPPIDVESPGPGVITDGDPDISSTSQPSFLDLGPGLDEGSTTRLAEEGGRSDLSQGRENLDDLLEDLQADDIIKDEEDPHTLSHLFHSDHAEDNPDPFVIDHHIRQSTPDLQELPDHVVIIYAMVSWLHLQFSLSRIACNAVLAILVYLLALLNPNIPHPFVTLQSATRSLGVDAHIELLAVCPTCRDVFPSALSKHAQEACPACNVPLFLSDHTKRGNQRAKKVPVIKYPYLSLSDQIESILKVPGVEALLDEWRIKPRRLGEYTDIFNGDMCRNILKAPDGLLFFSNLPHERAGPKGEL